jgi:glycosyltransferase involved in cell wall biosynthesis
MHVLHITAWFPNSHRSHEGIFVQRHIDSLQEYCSNTVWQIEARPGKKWATINSGMADRTLIRTTPINKALLLEWWSFLLILHCWITRKKSQRFDLVNLHIAYPNAVHIKALIRWFKLPVVITEHHSAYHFSFGSSAKGLDRTRKLFHLDIPVITVSDSLANDIKKFSGNSSIKCYVVDNVVDTKVFHPDASQAGQNHLFMVAGWKKPKRPDVVLKALNEIPGLALTIGGDGPQIAEMRRLVDELNMEDRVEFIGRLQPEEVASEMREAMALLLPSEYETFSVVCAESLCCGTPVIASNVGGIPGFINPSNGILVKTNEVSDWNHAIRSFLPSDFNGQEIARSAMLRFSQQSVGEAYFNVLRSLANRARK